MQLLIIYQSIRYFCMHLYCKFHESAGRYCFGFLKMGKMFTKHVFVLRCHLEHKTTTSITLDLKQQLRRCWDDCCSGRLDKAAQGRRAYRHWHKLFSGAHNTGQTPLYILYIYVALRTCASLDVSVKRFGMLLASLLAAAAPARLAWLAGAFRATVLTAPTGKSRERAELKYVYDIYTHGSSSSLSSGVASSVDASVRLGARCAPEPQKRQPSSSSSSSSAVAFLLARQINWFDNPTERRKEKKKHTQTRTATTTQTQTTTATTTTTNPMRDDDYSILGVRVVSLLWPFFFPKHYTLSFSLSKLHILGIWCWQISVRNGLKTGRILCVIGSVLCAVLRSGSVSGTC